MKNWIMIAVILALLFGMNYMIGSGPYKAGHDHSHSEEQSEQPPQQQTPKPAATEAATMEPGRVVELKTSKGDISFILFEKDCPNTTARIVALVQAGGYKNVSFPRVEDWIVQTAPATIDVPGIDVEKKEGLTHAKGAVGMARKGQDMRSNTSVFYILKEPQPMLDGDYTVFGRLIKGMDVVMKITPSDKIISANILQLKPADLAAYQNVLKLEAQRRTQ